jgi:outer membrane protein OmpA-like peptidoglycan-associated protein
MSPYIFSTACAYICIFISLSGCYHLAPEGVRVISPTSKAHAAISGSLLSGKQYQDGMRSGRGMSAGAGIPAMGENPSGLGSEAAATPTKRREQRRAYPHFLKRSVLFEPNSLSLTSESEKRLALDAVWLRMHPEIRTVVVGFCDTLGSEECTHELAEQRGVAVKQFLLEAGVDSPQIVGVKGWEKAEPICESPTPNCQEMNRRARIFVAGLSPAR